MDDVARDRLAGPASYDLIWFITGAVLVCAAIVWAVALRRSAQRAARVQEAAQAAGSTSAMHAQLTQRLRLVEQQLQSGELQAPQAALELAAIARAWVAGASRAATATELEQRGFERLAQLVRTSYPPAFAQRSDDVQQLLDDVREFISS